MARDAPERRAIDDSQRVHAGPVPTPDPQSSPIPRNQLIPVTADRPRRRRLASLEVTKCVVAGRDPLKYPVGHSGIIWPLSTSGCPEHLPAEIRCPAPESRPTHATRTFTRAESYLSGTAQVMAVPDLVDLPVQLIRGSLRGGGEDDDRASSAQVVVRG
jgi:hypothetical protein